MADVKPISMLVRDFSKVILTLENVLIPDEKLSPTPSMQDGLDLETEIDLRILGCELIQTSGILLKLPQVAMATGQVLFQRLYYSKSFVKHDMEVLAMACINLASKIEECPRRIRDVINVFHHIKQIRNKKNIHPMALDQTYVNSKSQVIKAERRVLKELGFCVHVKHPHKVIVMYLQVLESEQNQKLVQCAWWVAHLQHCQNVSKAPCISPSIICHKAGYGRTRNSLALHHTDYHSKVLVDLTDLMVVQRNNNIVDMELGLGDRIGFGIQNYMNDSFRTDVFVRWHPETIACACIYLAARQLKVPLPNSPPWYELFGVFEDEIKDICLSILRLYARKKPNYEALEKKVNAARHIQSAAKKKSMGLFSGRDTPVSNSGQDSPKNVSPNPTLLGSIKRLKKEEDDRHSSDKKKRKNGFSPSRSRSRSRSSRSSRSLSPAPKKRKHRSPSPSNKSRKERYSPDRRVKDKSRKRKHRSRSRSNSSPTQDYKSHKKRSKDKDRENKDKDRYYSPDRHSRKHRNGHHHSPSRDRVDKYDKYDSKYDKYRR